MKLPRMRVKRKKYIFHMECVDAALENGNHPITVFVPEGESLEAAMPVFYAATGDIKTVKVSNIKKGCASSMVIKW